MSNKPSSSSPAASTRLVVVWILLMLDPLQGFFPHSFRKQSPALLLVRQAAAPKPPPGEPSDDLLNKAAAYFAKPLDDDNKNKYNKDKDKEQLKEKAQEAGQKLLDDVVKPMLTQQKLQRAVPVETIKGAALVGAALTFAASKGLLLATSAGAMSAAYVAISQGVVGDVLRTVGGITWDATEAAYKLAQLVTGGKAKDLPKDVMVKLIEAVQVARIKAQEYQQAQELQQQSSTTSTTTTATATASQEQEAEQAYVESQQDLVRVLEEAETAIDAADDAIAKADLTLSMEDDEEETEEDDTVTNKEEVVEAEEEVTFTEMEEEDEYYEDDEEEKLEAKEDTLEIDDDEDYFEEEEEETQAEDDYDWEDAVELAQQGLEGKIVGIEEAITDKDAKANWDAAGMLAQELQQAPEDDDDDDDDMLDLGDIDIEALGRAAREAVEQVEQRLDAGAEAKKQQREEWAASMDKVGTDELEDDDDDEDFFDDDLELLAEAARSAVDQSENTGGVEETDDDDMVDFDDDEDFSGFEDEVATASETQSALPTKVWSELTVVKLREELQIRGLKSYGKKSDLVDRLVEYEATKGGSDMDDDLSTDDDEDDLLDLGDIDIDELGRRARAAVEMNEDADGDGLAWLDDEDTAVVDLDKLGEQARAAAVSSVDDEPSDEVLMQLESEEPLLFEDSGAKDYSSMTVAELKDELRSKGLKVGGKKAELIERLESS